MSRTLRDTGPEEKAGGSRLRFGLSIIALLTVIALLLFIPAGRVDWPAAWIWLATMLFGILVVRQFVVRTHPDLPTRRRTVGAGTPTWDRKILAVFRMAILATLIVSALDAGRYAWSSLPPIAGAFGLGLIFAGLGLFGASVIHNPFFESTVRIQAEIEHRVASSGPYRVIRHPGYTGMLMMVLGAPLLLGSAWALMPTGVAWASLVLRTVLEDEYLRDRLPGYAEYATDTRFRLVPGVW